MLLMNRICRSDRMLLLRYRESLEREDFFPDDGDNGTDFLGAGDPY